MVNSTFFFAPLRRLLFLTAAKGAKTQRSHSDRITNLMTAKRRRFDVPIASGKRSPSQRYRGNDRSRSSSNNPLVEVGIVVATILVTTLFLLSISGQISDTTAGNLIALSAPPEKSIASPASPQPSLTAGVTPIAQPTRSAAPTPETEKPAGSSDDPAIQAEVDKKLEAEGSLSAQGITATVVNGKVTLVGTAPSDELKSHIEKLVRAIKGVRQVDNQIVVIANM
jgi:BON domain